MNRSKLLLFVQVVFVVIMACFCTGCVGKYSKINFCWKSDHRIAPDQRFLVVDAEPEQVKEQLLSWVEDTYGEVIKEEAGTGKVARIVPDSSEKYLKARKIADERWESYNKNSYRSWEKEDIESFRKLMDSQVEWLDAENENTHKIVAQMMKRKITVNYRVVTGYKNSGIYVPPTILTLPHRTMVAPGSFIPNRVPIYANRSKLVGFYSVIEFNVFKDNGRTTVYATGHPVEAKSATPAGYGTTIGYAYWPMINGKHEMDYIRNAFTYLKEQNNGQSKK